MRFLVVVFALLLISVQAEEPTTLTWIGGASGSLLTESNWDPAGLPQNENWARITNSVTFTESGKDYYWRNAKLTIVGKSTVNFGARFWFPKSDSYLINKKDVLVDIEEGSSLNATYMIGGKNTATFIKTGKGSIVGRCIGSSGNLYEKIRILDGAVSLYGGEDNCLRAVSSIEIGEDASVKVESKNGIDTSTASARVLVQVDGILDFNSQAQKIDGLTGSGIVTNAFGGVKLQMRAQKQNVFSGRFHGRLEVAPLADAPEDACLIIGDADTLKYTDLIVSPSASNPHPIKFKPGIGVFYARTYPKNRIFYDTLGNVVEIKTFANHLYVSCEQKDDSGDGLTPGSAYKTIAAALRSENLKALPDLNIIHVASGTYDSGEMGTENDLSRVELPGNVYLVSEKGAEKTFIVGKASNNSPADCKGCGPGAVRCAKLSSGARIEGFTLTGGYTYSTAKDSGKCGAGVECADVSCYIVDCVISNNVSRRGGAGHKGTYIRTKILFNSSTEVGSGLYEDCNLYNCVLNGNGGVGFYSAGARSLMVNCFFGPDGTSIRADGTSDELRTDAYNTIFLSPILSNGGQGMKMRLHNCLTMDTVPSDVEVDEDCILTNGFANADSKLAWLGFDSNFTPRFSTIGVVVDRGKNEYYSIPDSDIAMIDIAGNSRIAGSSIDIGAYEALYDRTLVSIEDEDVGLLLEGIEKGLTEFTQEQAVKFTIKRTFNSPYLCTGFMLNGVFVDFEQYPNGWTTNITNATLADSMTIVAVYAKVASLYVDANNGKEENCGYHPKYPKKTLKSVLQLPALPGSVIYAAAGWYTNETMTSASNYGEQLSRVVVPSGISLVSLEGPEKTFIGGMVSPEPPASDTRGCGPGSIRCVTLSSKSSLIKGFTCIGGRVNCNDKTHGSYGGGVYGAGAVEDCVFIDCGATRGGGVSHASVVRRCKFINCSASYIGAALNEIAGLGVYNCIFDACTNGTHIVLNSIPLVNCTFLPSCKANTAAHSSNENAYPVAPSNIINSAIFCAPFSNPKKAMYTNCAFMRYSDISGVSLGEGSIILETNQTGILGMAKMNADGSLCSGSPLIDAGSNLLYNADFAADTALYGTQRIYNKKIDIGACEYDWRGEFSRSLRSSRSFSLMEASENVTLNAGGGVQLCGGESISVVWDRVDTASRDFSFDVDFGGEGQLTYRLGEETFTVTASNEKKTITLKGISGRLELSIAFSGEGTAIVSGFKRADNGVILLLR